MIARVPLLARLRGGERGVALVEFAMVFPVLILLFLAGYQVSDAIACNRKVTITTRAIADLATRPPPGQATTGDTSAADLDLDLNAATQIMAPYSASQAMVRVSEITVSSSFPYKTTVTWSRAVNGTAYAKGAAFTLPANFTVPGVSLIYAETNYAYKPAANYGFVRAMSLKDGIYMMPRSSSSIDCDDCYGS